MSIDLNRVSDFEYYSSLKELCDCFDPYSFDEDCIGRSKQVIEFISSTTVSKASPKLVSFKLPELLNSGLENFLNIGCGVIVDDAVSILNSIDYFVSDNAFSNFYINSEIVGYGRGFEKVSKNMIIPSSTTSISSVFLSHEISHALKETNCRECKSIVTISEVIPMLLELVIALNKGDETLRNVFRERFNVISDIAINYKKVINDYNRFKNTEYAEKFKFILGCYGNYLNSFYYVVILFNYYLENPKHMIDMINQVLMGYSTTEQLIDVVFNKIKYKKDFMDCTEVYLKYTK